VLYRVQSTFLTMSSLYLTERALADPKLPETLPASPRSPPNWRNLFYMLLKDIVFAMACMFPTPLPAFLIVSKEFYSRRGEALRLVRESTFSKLREDVVERCGRLQQDIPLRRWVDLSNEYHRLLSEGRVLSFIYRQGVQTRFIREGFDRQVFIDERTPNRRVDFEAMRNIGVRVMINSCINDRQGNLNKLVLMGIFSSFDNRSDAIQVIRFYREFPPNPNWLEQYSGPRSEIILRLLETSFHIDDISRLQSVGGPFTTAHLSGWQLTIHPDDLQRFNALTERPLRLTMRDD